MRKVRIFQVGYISICAMFSLVMAFVTVIAYLRPSGITGIDPSKMQLIRHQAEKRSLKIDASEKKVFIEYGHQAEAKIITEKATQGNRHPKLNPDRGVVLE